MKSQVINILTIIILTFAHAIYGQGISTSNEIKAETDFKNQGEQEDYWAIELFKNDYKKQYFKKYSGEINVLNENKIMFGKTIIELSNCSPDLKRIFKKGFIYPEILNATSLRISDVEELDFLNESKKIKRFRFLLWNEIIMHPTVYFFEMTNDKATKKTDLNSFIENSELTFLKSGWIMR